MARRRQGSLLDAQTLTRLREAGAVDPTTTRARGMFADDTTTHEGQVLFAAARKVAETEGRARACAMLRALLAELDG